MATSPQAETTTRRGPMLPVPYRLARKRSETHDTWTIELEPADGQGLERFAPGQFGMLYRFGVGEAPISISGAGTGANGALVHTIRAVGPVSAALCAAPRGEVIGVRGPFGRGWPMTELEGADVLVVGGGIGIAPLRPVMLHLVAHRERYGNVALLYGGRSPRELLYGRDLERWGGRYDVQVDVQVTVDSADSGWLGRVGLVTDLIPHARFDPAETAAFVVGPELMMRVTVDALQQQGIGSERIWLSLELNMKCAIGHCGHCQLGPEFVCKGGPVFRHDRIGRFLGVREL
jgi:NAD(P)H-flavin reductase